MAAFPQLFLTWNGQEYACAVTMQVRMQIEQNVLLHKLAATVFADPTCNSVPGSHVAWVIFCLLRGAGAPVASSQQVYDAMEAEQLSAEDISAVLEFAIAETWGSGPEKPPKQAKKKKTSSTKKTRRR